MAPVRTDDGGPAFPRMTTLGAPETFGMSLRDYFAGQALIACMGSPRWVEGLDISAAKHGTQFSVALAEMAYQYADALLHERSKA